MSKFNEMIAAMSAADYQKKQQFLQYLVQMAQRAKHQFARDDKDALLAFAFEEVERMLRAIPEATSYKEKDQIFACEDLLLGLVMHLSGSPANLPEKEVAKITMLVNLVEKERYIETTLDSIFRQSAITEADTNRLLFWARQCTDEYQKAKLFLGLVHYQKDMGKFNDGARKMMTSYIASELRRLMALDTEDTWNALELLADVSKHFADEAVIAGLSDLVQLQRNHINHYAVDTLLTLGVQAPQTVIDALAKDLEYANLTYLTLQRHGKAVLFPAEFVSEEYLAKSDLVHWLTYPTELGKAPDEIEYIGKTKKFFSREVFHVFKYRSDSGNLDEALRGKWLIGWSSNQGGTFSNFDLFAPYENETTQRALKLIQKRLIG